MDVCVNVNVSVSIGSLYNNTSIHIGYVHDNTCATTMSLVPTSSIVINIIVSMIAIALPFPMPFILLWHRVARTTAGCVEHDDDDQVQSSMMMMMMMMMMTRYIRA
jgi:hypothetical protein